MYGIIGLFIGIFLQLLTLNNSLKIISLQPGGLNGFYLFGISKYIKENYDLEDTLYFGSSAGAWNAVYLSNKNPVFSKKFQKYLENLDISNMNNLYDIEHSIKKFYIQHSHTNDFNLKQIHICVSQIKKFGLRKKIYSNFNSIEDAINCCMASSHIPFVTDDNLFFTYKNKLCVDGGFFEYPHPSKIYPNIILHPHMWKNPHIRNFDNFKTFNVSQHIQWGYQDAFSHKKELDVALF